MVGVAPSEVPPAYSSSSRVAVKKTRGNKFTSRTRPSIPAGQIDIDRQVYLICTWYDLAQVDGWET